MNGESLNSSALKRSWDVPLQREVQICGMSIAHVLTRGMGWGRCEPPEPADEGKGVKPSLNAGSSRLQSWSSSPGRLYAQSGAFLASSPDLEIDVKWGGAKTFFAGEGLFLLRLEGNGDLFLSSFGGIEEINVDGTLSVDTGHIVAFEETLDFKIRKAGGLKATLLSGEGLVAEFAGKGKIWIQTRSIAEYIGWLVSLLPRQTGRS